jgi:hypothetical protein
MNGTGFEIVGGIESIETMVVRRRIRHLRGLEKQYGKGRWRKLKGVAFVRLADRRVRLAELHWYEAHGIGRRRFKIKRFLDQKD